MGAMEPRQFLLLPRAFHMGIGEARRFVNQSVKLSWFDRKGDEVSDTVQVLDVGFVPLYGPCLITSRGDIRLDRIRSCEPWSNRAAA